MSPFYWALIIGGIVGVFAIAWIAWACCVVAGRADDRAERMSHELRKM